ncbi:phenylacetate--CoA ligase family protein [Solirhodobacter olei]|uniref:phenylacetate--CoA ligase family protein n=1 Tax=Solirhodobacter olei TaxID=2493082 RepID=UPI000FDCC1BB|nr:AMP-binding protein [Solirhodobacter olei]
MNRATIPADENDARYRAQIAYLFDRSPFYRERLRAAGFAGPEAVGGLDAITALPFTEKDDLRRSRTPENAIGAHLATPLSEVVRIYSTSGTTGTPSYIPLTKPDLANWITISSRSYGASGLAAGESIISTYNAGPFAAGAALDAFTALGLCHIPIGSGNTERLMTAVDLLRPDIIALTPSYALHLLEWAAARGIDTAASSVHRLMVAGEPGGGEPALRARLQEGWGAQVTEAMGIGDIAVSLWGECGHRQGMHFSGGGIIHFELIDPATGAPVPLEDGAEGELVYTHLNHRAAPLLRFRSRDHVRVFTAPCPCGRPSPRIRCLGRTDDMLIVRGVNLYPSALREVIGGFTPAVSGVISIRPQAKGPKQAPPLPVVVELAEGADAPAGLAEAIARKVRETLVATVGIRLVPAGSLPRTDYKSKLVDWSEAREEGRPQ